MLIHPTFSRNYRNWAYCCARIRDLFKSMEAYSAGKVTCMAEYSMIKTMGRNYYDGYCLEKCHRISRRIAGYLKLRDSIASEIGFPEKHLLRDADMLHMIGNVIETTSRHGKEKSYCALNGCSADGSKINGLDAYDLLALGYGK